MFALMKLSSLKTKWIFMLVTFSNLTSYEILITFHSLLKALNDGENALALIPFQTAFILISTFGARLHFDA